MEESPPIVIFKVDDDEGSRAPVSRILRQAGFAVTEAAAGHEALRLIASTKPQLVVLEVRAFHSL